MILIHLQDLQLHSDFKYEWGNGGDRDSDDILMEYGRIR